MYELDELEFDYGYNDVIYDKEYFERKKMIEIKQQKL